MKRYILLSLFFALYNIGIGQGKIIDSLTTALNNAKEDTARLKIYMALGNTVEKKDKLLYAEPAWSLVDKLFLIEKNDKEREKLIRTERSLPDLITAYYTSKDTTDWDKAMGYLNNRVQIVEKTGDKKRTAEFLNNMAGIYLDEKKDSAMFRKYMLKSITIAKEINDGDLIVRCYGFMLAFYTSAANLTDAFEAVQASIAVTRQMNYNKGLARSLTMLAELYGYYGEDELALENYQSALNMVSKIKDTTELYNTLLSWGDFYSRKKNIEKALEYYNKILGLNPVNNKSGNVIGRTYWAMGQLYLGINDHKNAIVYFEKSRDMSDSINNTGGYTTALLEIGIVYNKMGHFEKALEYHKHTYRILNSIDSWKRTIPYLDYILAQDYYGLKQYDEAKKLNEKAIIDFKRFWFEIGELSNMELLATQIDSARGDGLGAFAHYKEYMSLKEKIRGDEIRKEAQKDKFKTEMEKQKAEQEKKDAIAKRTRNMQYIAIGAISLLGIFLLYGYIQKNKDNKRIEKAYTDLKSTQQQLVQSEKMASLGELTAGIAHEIQNPLNFVNNFSEVNEELLAEMRDELDKGNIEDAKTIANDAIENQQKILHHGKRADAIVKGMLQHSRSSSGVKEPTNINALADEYLRLAYHGLRAKDKSFNATIKTDFNESIGDIHIIPQDIGRVILNLINNAFYAVNDKSKQGIASYEPTVSISTKKEDNKVLVSVKDNGNGIPQKVLDKIFQPFFTTKPTGQGTGLGLSLSYDIVKAHGGEIKVLTKVNEGTEFIILLSNV